MLYGMQPELSKENILEVAHTFFPVVLFGSLPPAITAHSLTLSLSSPLCVADISLLEGGGGGLDSMKRQKKTVWTSSNTIFAL
jgi:hypothetical protein